MKKLLLSLVVLATIFSCGKKGTVSSNGSATSGLSSSITGTLEVNLATAINNDTFGSGYAASYLTWNQLVANQPNLTYYYYKSGTSSSSCSTKWGIFYVCTSGSSNSATFSRSVVNSSVDIAAKKSELINIINNRSSIQQNGTAYYIYTTGAKYYIIDTAKPLQVNPVQVQDNSSGSASIEYFGYAM